MKTELSMPNKKQSNYLFKQNKNQSPDVKMKYRNCYASGMIHDYMEKSSAFDKLYDFMDIKEQKLYEIGGEKFIIAKEAPTYTNFPAYRVFNVSPEGEKRHVASIMDYYGHGYRLYDHDGRVPYKKEYIRDYPVCAVNDATMKGFTPFMKEVKDYFNDMLDNASISKLDTKGKFCFWHADFIDNFADFVKEILRGGGNVDKDTILNIDKYIQPDELSPQNLMKSELLEKGKFSLYNNTLEINTEFLQGSVPVFKTVVPDIKNDRTALKIKIELFQPFTFCKIRSHVLDEQESTFVKSLCRYLTEINKLVNADKLNKLTAIRTLLR